MDTGAMGVGWRSKNIIPMLSNFNLVKFWLILTAPLTVHLWPEYTESVFDEIYANPEHSCHFFWGGDGVHGYYL